MIFEIGDRGFGLSYRQKRYIQTPIHNLEELDEAVRFIYRHALQEHVKMLDPIWTTFQYRGNTILDVEFTIALRVDMETPTATYTPVEVPEGAWY